MQTVEQCKDISDDAFLRAVSVAYAERGIATRWDVARILEEAYGEIPEKVVIAKSRKLIRSGKIGGCGCGCRGDYTIKEVWWI